MAWKRRSSLYEVYRLAAENASQFQPDVLWELDVWQITEDHPKSQQFSTTDLQWNETKAKLRIVIAPSARPRCNTVAKNLEFFQALNIPDDFATERVRNVTHSFAFKTEDSGWCSWFHFLCKNIDIRDREDGSGAEIYNHAAALGIHERNAIAGADYTWNDSTFFLRYEKDVGATLVCFGPVPDVQMRIHQFIESGAWECAIAQPLVLYDLVMEGLHVEADITIWKMNVVFGAHEKNKFQLSQEMISDRRSSDNKRSASNSQSSFTELHNCAKHVIFLGEALESCIMVVNRITTAIETTCPGGERRLVDLQLRECLEYRLSLLKSSQLRLESLLKRIDNSITLSFNLVTQRDSMVMIQDSNTMKLIAAITMIFLPTTAVASVIGSQLFIATHENGRWDVAATPLFRVMWCIAIPLTFSVGVFAFLWYDWNHGSGTIRYILGLVNGCFNRWKGRWTTSPDPSESESKTQV